MSDHIIRDNFSFDSVVLRNYFTKVKFRKLTMNSKSMNTRRIKNQWTDFFLSRISILNYPKWILLWILDELDYKYVNLEMPAIYVTCLLVITGNYTDLLHNVIFTQNNNLYRLHLGKTKYLIVTFWYRYSKQLHFYKVNFERRRLLSRRISVY